MLRFSLRLLCQVLVALAASALASAVTLEQVISREDPTFQVSASRLQVGRDGLIYLSSGGNTSYVLRVARDGSRKLGSATVYALSTAAANADGIIATGNAHFSHSVNLYSPAFAHLGAVSDFLNNDAVGYNAPGNVEAGQVDFYAVDNSRNRIVRVTPAGKMLTSYPLHRAEDGVKWNGYLQEIRVCEKVQRFYCLSGGMLYCTDFAGNTLWSVPLPVGGNQWDGYSGGYDVDLDGTLYYIGQDGKVVKTLNLDGKPGKEYPLQLGERAGRYMDLRLFRNEVVIKRYSPTELFQVYDLATGALKSIYNADVERLAGKYSVNPMPFPAHAAFGGRFHFARSSALAFQGRNRSISSGALPPLHAQASR